MVKRLAHPLGKTIAHNQVGTPTKATAQPSSVPAADSALKTLKTTTKLARIGGQAASSDVGGPADTNPI